MLSKTNRTAWRRDLLRALDALGEEGIAAADYLRARNTHIGFWRVRKHVGAFWTMLRTIHLNTVHYSPTMNPADPRVTTMIIHEVKHLQQGVFVALSVYGELEAWQLQFRLYHRLTNAKVHKAIEEMLSLPLERNRSVLSRARELMQEYAGRGYRADLLPLYPLGEEIRFRLFGAV